MRATIVWPVIVGLTWNAFGCSADNREDASQESSGSTSQNVSGEQAEDMSPQTRLEKQKAIAAEARSELFQSLLGQLSASMQAKGPAQSIDVCKNAAPAIARKVGAEKGVRIGRTSLQLRNSANQPPEWAMDFVDSRKAEEVVVELAEGAIGVLSPIRLKATCEVCHGAKDKLMPEVQTALAQHYPDDEATGYAEGDLRGYFWVEVPGN